MSRRRVVAEHSSAELSEWRAFDRAFGLGVDADYRAGVVAAAVWNAGQGGVPVEGGVEGSRRYAVPGDFFAVFNTDDDAGQSTGGVTHDSANHDSDDLEVDDLDGVVDEAAEIARVSEAMKNMWAMHGLKYNAALRAAEQLDAGEPPANPDAN